MTDSEVPKSVNVDLLLQLAEADVFPDHQIGSKEFNMVRYGDETPPNWMLIILCGMQEYLSDPGRAAQPSTQTTMAEYIGTTQPKISTTLKRYPQYFERPGNRYVQMLQLPEHWVNRYADLMASNTGEQGFNHDGTFNTGQTPQMKKMGARVNKALSNTEYIIKQLKEMHADIKTQATPVETKTSARTENSQRTRVYLSDAVIADMDKVRSTKLVYNDKDMNWLMGQLHDVILELDNRGDNVTEWISKLRLKASGNS